MKDNPEIKPEESLFEAGLVSVEDSRNQAAVLLEKYQQEILSQSGQDVNGWHERFVTESYQNAIRHYLREVPKEILQQFWGHGITRGRDEDRLTAALNILSNSVVKGDCSQLASSYISAYDDGDFLLILDKENPFPPRLSDGTRNRNQLGLKVNFGTLVVNTKFYPLVEDLKKFFPHRDIIKASELPDFFKQ